MNTEFLFTLPADNGEDFVAAEHLPLVVYFYPKDATPGCTTEAQAFRDHIEAFKSAGYTVVGISRDSVKSHQNFVCKQELNFPLLSDKEETVCRQFDVIKEKNMYGKKVMGIERSTFILNSDGEMVHQWRKVKVAGHVEEVLATVQNLAKSN
ncbi:MULTISPECIES: peroxiredoxin [Vitreoscilla]|uniref:thioredoxin-dependent peroxiredoxin n=1 Tax=Vitreoscilla stercoraria TaxID=61 RepID=A0ABY4EBI7_VITST|nr:MULTISPECIES: peroxiredoxin [Vitreoscilla]AUZ04017.1 putative thioredoxin [Vitreoscilla sp. C1]UOO93115.1 peroxiredoxin [Vitreoscilla stercoraria]